MSEQLDLAPIEARILIGSWPSEALSTMHADALALLGEVKRLRAQLGDAWDEGVATALNHAIRNDDEITLRLEHLDGRPWVNPYRREAEAGGP